jgi:hypothetical protein
MASGGKEHRMVFDIRGRRKHVVKAVYAILAILMGASLFLVVGPVNIGNLLGNNSGGSSEAAAQLEGQAARIERKLTKDPENSDLLLGLARARVNAGNLLLTEGPRGERSMTLESFQQYSEASDAWTKYLKATDEPTASAAQLMSQTLFNLAQTSRTSAEAEANIRAAAQAQKIVAEQRPNLNSLSTLAFYTMYTFDYAAAEKAGAEASKLANSKFERENFENQLEEISKRAHEYQKQLKETEKAEKAQRTEAGGGGGNPESLENPGNPFGGLGGGGLSE